MPAINFKVEGEGLPVVLIHGFCENHEMWKHLVPTLSKNYKVYTIDLPGFGQSPLWQTTVSLESVASAVADWVEDQKIDKAVFIGHSLGGYVCLALAELYSKLVAGVGLVHSTAFADSEEGKINRNRVIEFIDKHGHEKWIETFAPSLFAKNNLAYCQEAVAMVHAMGVNTKVETIVAYTLAMRDRKDRFEVWQNIANHCLYIGGSEDIRIPARVSEEHIYARDKIDGYILPEIGHMGMLEDENQFKVILENYLGKIT
ncbi:alpha/beta hydrolase [Roseivirga sp. UBA1976]|uniref:alpha/beta fold hydrolase n=1 Tax=Roseivirga sp. UBA1976 TaxID=1947386 RepID=UPI00257E7182|nr:alpha/beta hydrolase [Roseivirga sp. UBA1976]|tara:strand:+ start:8203 stop:8976 length:774 start_codon:yes stop_codon:yes gene_type:complete